MRLGGKVSIITGCGSGIGKASTVRFAREGSNVISVVHSAKDIPELERETRSLLGKVVAVEADVSSENDMRRVVQTAVSEFGGVDVLFNNAGMEFRALVTDTTVEQWDRVMDVNAKAVFLACKYVVPEMIKREKGSIIINASINAVHGNTSLVAYTASKGAAVSMTRALALDYAPHNIRVNAICPAVIIDTRLIQKHVVKADNPQVFVDELISRHPLGRVGTSDEVAYTALFLASDESSFITGEDIRVDGGWHIR